MLFTIVKYILELCKVFHSSYVVHTVNTFKSVVNKMIIIIKVYIIKYCLENVEYCFFIANSLLGRGGLVRESWASPARARVLVK